MRRRGCTLLPALTGSGLPVYSLQHSRHHRHALHVTCYMSRVTCHVSRVTCHVLHVTCHYHYDRVTSDEGHACTTMATVSTSIPQLTCHVSRPAPRHVYRRFTRSPWTPGGASRWSPSERICFCFAEQNKNGNYVIANTTLEDVLDLIILSDNFFLNN